MQIFNNISISIRVTIAMFISFILAIGNVSTASAVGSTTQSITWTATYKAAKPNGEKIAPRTVNWVQKVG